MKTQTRICLALSLSLAIGSAIAAPIENVKLAGNTPGTDATPSLRLSTTQRSEAQSRIELANAIAQNVAADAEAKGLAADWRVNLLSSLYNLPSSALRGMSDVRTLGDAHTRSNAVTEQSTGTAKALDTGTSDLVFTPKTPCRFIDTRIGTPSISGTPRTFDTFNFGSSYGGTASCTLPGSGELAIAANITVVTPANAAPGYIVLRPSGSTALTSFINWPAGSTHVNVLANSGIITTALVGGDYKFEALTGGGTADMVVDYFGYFAPAGATALDCTTTTASVALAAGFSGFKNSAACASGYTPVSAYCNSNFASAVYSTGSGVVSFGFCVWQNNSGAIQNVLQATTCCRVP